MANKKIIVSDGSGRYQEMTSSFGIDDGKLSMSNVVVSTSSYGGATSGSIMQILNDRLQPIATTSNVRDGNPEIPENLSGTIFQYRDGIGISPSRIETAGFSGDIIGNLNSIKVISVENVDSGTLDSKYGGTNANSFQEGSLVTLSGSGINPSGNSNKVVAVNNSGNWSAADKSILDFTPMTGTVVYLYTGSVSATTASATAQSFTWNKPGTAGAFPSNTGTPRFIRVICQGAGGGGGAGGTTSTLSGIGGAGGGYVDITFDASYISSSVTCSIGNGGRGATGNANGGSGASSSFGDYIYSSGGAGGLGINNTAANASVGGVGYNYFGGSGSAYITSTTSSATVVLGGAGGGGGGTTTVAGRSGGSNIFLNLTASAGGAAGGGTALPPQSGTLFAISKCFINNNQTLQNVPYLQWAGGSGGGSTNTAGVSGGSGSSPQYGSGGGGGGRGVASGGAGGNGGAGYILIICS